MDSKDSIADFGLQFAGRVALVTGASTGIGAATARMLASLGADVAIASRSEEKLNETARQIASASGRQCLAIPTDVREEEQVVALVKSVLEHFGRIDILVNNAGGTKLAALENVTTEMWEKNFSLNVDSAYFCTREAGRHFREQRSGAVVNVSSMAGVHGTRQGVPYSASKAALQMFTRVAAAEWGPYGIRVNCVAPGMILSGEATQKIMKSSFDLAEVAKVFPLQRTGTPEDVARAIVFLASDAASYISGETLAVCGGPVLGGPST